MPFTKTYLSNLGQWGTGQRYGAQALYLGLCAAGNLDTVNMTAVEPSASTYARVQLSDGLSNPTAINNVFVGATVTYDEDGTVIIKNNKRIHFNDNKNPLDPTDIQNWGVMHYALIYSALTGGQLLGYAILPTDISVTSSANTVPLVRIGDLKFYFGNLAAE